jgi:hypothetical protein
VLFTAEVEKFWLARTFDSLRNYAISTYVGTRSGLFRGYPGHSRRKADYDPYVLHLPRHLPVLHVQLW